MIKAKKGLIITLFAAMMIFAFGATSAFAVEKIEGSWEPDYSKVTFTNVPSYGTVVLDAERNIQSDGVIVAKPDDSEYVNLGATCDLSPVYYFDFQGAAIKGIVGNYPNWDAFKTAFDAAAAANGVVVVTTPSYVDNAKTAEKTYDANLAAHGWKVVLKQNGDKDSVAAQTVTVTGTLDATVEVKGAYNSAFGYNNTGITKTVSVGESAAATGFYKDEITDPTKGEYINAVEDAETEVTFWYTGKAHTIVNTLAKDHTIAWSVRNANGVYEAVGACPSFTDVDGTFHYVRATETWVEKTSTTTTTVTKKYTFKVSVNAPEVHATAKWVPMNGNALVHGEKYYEVTPEQAADPEQFIAFANGLNAKLSSYEKGFGDEDADQAAIKGLFDAMYEIKVTKNSVDPNLQKWQIVAKTLTKDDIKAIEKTYEQMLANYGFDYDKFISAPSDMARNVKVVEGPAPVLQDDVVDITYAPAKVTYKAKALKKKAKSFTVESVTKSGKAVTYTLKTSNKKITIDSATGKVTVGKKLKKGTYKITVIARTADGQGYKAAEDTATITIKVKK